MTRHENHCRTGDRFEAVVAVAAAHSAGGSGARPGRSHLLEPSVQNPEAADDRTDGPHRVSQKDDVRPEAVSKPQETLALSQMSVKVPRARGLGY
jgi:hypothetical protein